jgi:hypothetical protein
MSGDTQQSKQSPGSRAAGGEAEPRRADTAADAPGAASTEGPASTVLTFLIDPETFFRRRADRPAIREAAAVVALAAIVSVLGAALVSFRLSSVLPENARLIARVTYLLSLVVGVAGVFLNWLVLSGVFHAISRLFDADGSFRRVAALVGWGFVPTVISGLVTAAVVAQVYYTAQLPTDPSGIDAFVQGLRSRPLMEASRALGLPIAVWQVVLWTFAVRHARGLSIGPAIACVAPPGAVMVGVNVAAILGIDLLGALGPSLPI